MGQDMHWSHGDILCLFEAIRGLITVSRDVPVLPVDSIASVDS